MSREALDRAVMSRPIHQSMAKVVRSCPASANNSDIPDHAMDIRGFYLKTQPPPFAEPGALLRPRTPRGMWKWEDNRLVYNIRGS